MITTIYLPFVELMVTASSNDEINLRRSLQLRRSDFSPRLPSGMSVDTAVALIARVRSTAPIYDFTFAVRLAKQNPTGLAETGEHLDAQSWSLGDGKLMIGTEDADKLCDRIDWFEYAQSDYPITLIADGIEIDVPMIPAKRMFDFHFVIAYNAIDRQCDSEGFAVDVPHRLLTELPSLTAVKWM